MASVKISLTLGSLASVLVVIGCGEREQRSMVGNFGAPEQEILKGEILRIETDLAEEGVFNGKKANRVISYEIRRGGDVRFEQRLRNQGPFSPGDVDVLEEIRDFHLSQADYAFVRSKLALLRPRDLGWGIFVRPNGCQHVLDSPFELSVEFSRGEKKWAIFQLQYACKSPDAEKARKTLGSVVEHLDETGRSASGK